MADDKKKDEKPKKGDAPAKGEGKQAKGDGGGDKGAKAKGGGAEAKGGKGGGGDKGAKGKKEAAPAQVYKRTGPPRLKAIYQKDVVPRLMQEFKYRNPMQVPRPQKVTINMGLGEAVQNPKILDSAVEELRTISGQAPVVTRAKKAIANFKLRQGLKIGAMVTLRRERMWEFLDRLINLALPRVRDFKGVSLRAFDGRGNYSLGIREQIIFPEINYDDIAGVRGLDVAITTSAPDDEQALALLRSLGLPFAEDRRET